MCCKMKSHGCAKQQESAKLYTRIRRIYVNSATCISFERRKHFDESWIISIGWLTSICSDKIITMNMSRPIWTLKSSFLSVESVSHSIIAKNIHTLSIRFSVIIKNNRYFRHSTECNLTKGKKRSKNHLSSDVMTSEPARVLVAFNRCESHSTYFRIHLCIFKDISGTISASASFRNACFWHNMCAYWWPRVKTSLGTWLVIELDTIQFVALFLSFHIIGLAVAGSAKAQSKQQQKE